MEPGKIMVGGDEFLPLFTYVVVRARKKFFFFQYFFYFFQEFQIHIQKFDLWNILRQLKQLEEKLDIY